MKFLIDAHILVWLLYEPERFTTELQKTLQESEGVYISVASLWELALKHQAGHLGYAPGELVAGAEALGLSVLPIQPSHIVAAGSVPATLTDVFDRMVVAQAIIEGYSVVTADKRLDGGTWKTLLVA
jgi:PIN domain nuclease of toxin-antitoxin system